MILVQRDHWLEQPLQLQRPELVPELQSPVDLELQGQKQVPLQQLIWQTWLERPFVVSATVSFVLDAWPLVDVQHLKVHQDERQMKVLNLRLVGGLLRSFRLG